MISNELNNAKPLYCSEDKRGDRTNSFEGMSEINLSYFVGIDATVSNPRALLAGDRNLTLTNVPVTRGLVTVTDPKTLSWSSSIHKQVGNLGLADGSAHQATPALLQRHLNDSGLQPNRFAVP